MSGSFTANHSRDIVTSPSDALMAAVHLWRQTK